MVKILPADKDRALWNFISKCPLVSGYLYFNLLREKKGSASLTPIPGDRVVKSYIDGSSIRHYDFALQFLFEVSDTTDMVNIENVFKLRVWQEWIEEQEATEKWPDFGDKCFGYRWVNLSTPNLAQLYDNGLAKYQFFARLQYREAK